MNYTVCYKCPTALLLGLTRNNLFVECQEKNGEINLWFVNSKLGIIIDVNLFLMGVAQGGFGDYALVLLDFICYQQHD